VPSGSVPNAARCAVAARAEDPASPDTNIVPTPTIHRVIEMLTDTPPALASLR
jgi:hypothetical protein